MNGKFPIKINSLPILKEKDWSLDLEDPRYVDHPEEIFNESVMAARQTKAGCYVNLVTPGECGDPRDWFIGPLADRLQQEGIAVRDVQYVDECGCGGYVTRLYRA